MVRCGVLFEVRTEFLNIIYTNSCFKGLRNATDTVLLNNGRKVGYFVFPRTSLGVCHVQIISLASCSQAFLYFALPCECETQVSVYNYGEPDFMRLFSVFRLLALSWKDRILYISWGADDRDGWQSVMASLACPRSSIIRFVAHPCSLDVTVVSIYCLSPLPASCIWPDC
jgi:hypothetical protein